MLVRSPSALALAGMVGAILFAPPVSAQSNPFIPASPVSKADVQRMLDERLASIRDEMAKSKADAAPTSPGTPGAPGMPSGAAVPGGMTPPGPMGMPGGSPMGQHGRAAWREGGLPDWSISVVPVPIKK